MPWGETLLLTSPPRGFLSIAKTDIIRELKNLEEFVFVSEAQKGRRGPRAIVESLREWYFRETTVLSLVSCPTLKSLPNDQPIQDDL
jgi:hypothetical protein